MNLQNYSCALKLICLQQWHISPFLSWSTQLIPFLSHAMNINIFTNSKAVGQLLQNGLRD